MPRVSEVVLVVSPRYANDVAMGVEAAGMVPRVERLGVEALAQCRDGHIRIAVVDARGALDQGLAIARLLGPEINRRQGGMLVLLSRSNGADTDLANESGATQILVSPFNTDAFGNALWLTARTAERLAARAGGGSDPVTREIPNRDALTGLATGDQLQQWVTTRLATSPALVVLTLGVGRIGAINAAYGRSVADEALRAVASRLGGIVNDRMAAGVQSRLLARLAAAEFAIAVSGRIKASDLALLAQQLVSAFATPFVIGDREIHLTARIGIASAGEDAAARSADVLIRQGSAALAAARAGEPGAITTFQPEIQGDSLLRMADLVGDLHHAIQNDDITLLFQPVLDLASGRIAGIEALVRWSHPAFGLLDAETLLETAATAELAIKLGRHIRARAMIEVMSWPVPLAGLRLALNITSADLADVGFADSLTAALATSGLPRYRLTLEVTEGALIENIDGAALVLEGLRQTGIHIALDDFGTGFSSLAWMARLPIDGIKLDRSFTRALGGSERERIVVETVVSLAKRLGLTVIAEGVEEPDQRAAAIAAGCDGVQGFEIAVPLSSRRLVEFCEGWVVSGGECS